MDDETAREISEANGVPLWLARLEPLWAYTMLTLAFALVAGCIAAFVWTLWFALC